MAEYRRAYVDLTRAEVVKRRRDLLKRGIKYRSFKDPNGHWEIWLLSK